FITIAPFSDSLLVFIFFFLLMIRRPPRSTLFPTRRSSDLATAGAARAAHPTRHARLRVARRRGRRAAPLRERVPSRGRACRVGRSEEHTSELQSPYDLVCRLLLEKKKKTKNVL